MTDEKASAVHLEGDSTSPIPLLNTPPLDCTRLGLRCWLITDHPSLHYTIQLYRQFLKTFASRPCSALKLWSHGTRTGTEPFRFIFLFFLFERVRIRSGICLSRGQHQSQTTDNRLCTKMDDDKMSSRTRPGSTVLC